MSSSLLSCFPSSLLSLTPFLSFSPPQLFKAVGQGSDAALLNTVIMGCVNVVSTFVAIYAVDRCGSSLVVLQATGQQAGSFSPVK